MSSRHAMLLASMTMLAAACSEEDQPEGPTEVATIEGFGTGSVTGKVTFSEGKEGIEVAIELQNCPDGTHPVHVHEGLGCATSAEQGPHWGPGGVRGEGIPNVECSGGKGRVEYVNTHDEADRVWTLDGAPDTDPAGHAFVVHAADGTRIGCGVIEVQ
jgi:Cu/Zn superoxide dismutase